MREANDKIANLMRDEDTKLAQRAKVKHIQEVGDNTKYFHLIVEGKHRWKTIFWLEQDEGTIVGQEKLNVYISEYYKNLFEAPSNCNVSMTETATQDITQLSNDENAILTADFTEGEVHDAILQMENNKALDPDGLQLSSTKIMECN